MQLKRFDLLFVKGRSPMSRLIQWVTKSPYSHVAIVLDELHVVETDWRQPLAVKHITYRPEEYDVYRYVGELSEQQEESMYNYLLKSLGKEYDYIQSITNGLYKLFGFPILNVPYRANCSEEADMMFLAGWIDLIANAPGLVTPADLSSSQYLKKVS